MLNSYWCLSYCRGFLLYWNELFWVDICEQIFANHLLKWIVAVTLPNAAYSLHVSKSHNEQNAICETTQNLKVLFKAKSVDFLVLPHQDKAKLISTGANSNVPKEKMHSLWRNYWFTYSAESRSEYYFFLIYSVWMQW